MSKDLNVFPSDSMVIVFRSIWLETGIFRYFLLAFSDMESAKTIVSEHTDTKIMDVNLL